MSGNVILGTEAMTYSEMLARYAPRPIYTEEGADRIQELIDALIDKPTTLTEDEQDFLTLLGALMFLWEDGRYDLEPSGPPHEAVKTLLELRGLRHVDLVGPVFPTASVASVILSGKRPLTYEYVRRLSEFFDVPADVFFPKDNSNTSMALGR